MGIRAIFLNVSFNSPVLNIIKLKKVQKRSTFHDMLFVFKRMKWAFQSRFNVNQQQPVL